MSILWNSMTSASFVFTELANTIKYAEGFLGYIGLTCFHRVTSLRFTEWSMGKGVLYNLVFTEWRHCVSQNKVWGKGCYITLFSPSDVTAFHRIVEYDIEMKSVRLSLCCVSVTDTDTVTVTDIWLWALSEWLRLSLSELGLVSETGRHCFMWKNIDLDYLQQMQRKWEGKGNFFGDYHDYKRYFVFPKPWSVDYLQLHEYGRLSVSCDSAPTPPHHAGHVT